MNGHLKELQEMVALIRLGYQRRHSEVMMKHTSLRSKIVSSVLLVRHREGFIKYYPQLVASLPSDGYPLLGRHVAQRVKQVPILVSDDVNEWETNESDTASWKGVDREGDLNESHGSDQSHDFTSHDHSRDAQSSRDDQSRQDVFSIHVDGSLQDQQRKQLNMSHGSAVLLKYVHGVPSMKKLVLDPNGGTWLSVRDLYGANSGFEKWILTTKYGVMTHEEAIRRNIGGLRLLIVS